MTESLASRTDPMLVDPDSASPAPEALRAENNAGIYGAVTRIGRLAVGQTVILHAGPNNLGTPSLITYRLALPRVGPLKIFSCCVPFGCGAVFSSVGVNCGLVP